VLRVNEDLPQRGDIEKKVILHVITSLYHGGAQRIMQTIAFSNRHLFEHVVVSLSMNGVIADELKESGITVFSINGKGFIGFIRIIRSLYLIIGRYRPSAVQTWMYHSDLIGGLVAKLLGVKKIIWSIHHDDPHKVSSATKVVAKICAMLSTYIPSHIVVCSSSALISHRSFGYSNEQLMIIDNGIDIGKFKFNSVRENNGQREFVVGHIARWHSIKGHELFVKAIGNVFHRHSNIRLVFIGTNIDSNNDKLMGLLKEARINEVSSLLGERDDIPELLAGMDLYVQSSMSESFSLTLVEAMASGVPSISTMTGIAMDLDDRLCIKVKVGDDDALSAAIEQAIEMPHVERVEMSEKARNMVLDRFDEKNMIDKYSDLYAK